MRKKQTIIKSLFIFSLVVGIILINNTISFGQFLEDYGNIGTLRILKGQVRDAADGLIPGAIVKFKNINSEKFEEFATDENSIFTVRNLPSGEYKVRVEIQGFNTTEFTVKVSPRSSIASKKFIIIRLSPGCASGGSVELESKVKKE